MRDSNRDDPTRTLAKRVRDGKVLIFVGAGMSVDAGMPGSDAIASYICAKAVLRSTETSLDRACEAYLGGYGNKPELDALVSDYLGQAQRSANREAFTFLKDLLPIPHIITTNFDTLIEDTLGLDNCHIIINTTDLQTARHSEQRKTCLYKIHGSISRPPLYLTDNDIRARPDATTSRALYRYLIDLASQHSLLFLGFRGRDANVIDWLRALTEDYGQRISDTRIFYVNPDVSNSDRGRFSDLGTFTPITLPARQFLSQLFEESTELRRNEPRVGTEISEKKKRQLPNTRNPFLLYKTDKIIEDEDVVALFYDDPPLTNKLTTPGSVVIIGGRGTGKSMLLRALTTRGLLPSLTSDRELQRLAVYVQLGGDFAHATKRYPDESAEQWRAFYQHYLNLFVAERIIATLGQCARMFPFVLSGSNLHDIANLLRLRTAPAQLASLGDLERDTILTRNTLDRRSFRDFAGTPETIIAGLFLYLQRALEPLFSHGLTLLIDDFEGDADQFGPLAVWIHARKFDAKLACQHFCFVNEAREFLEKSEDYTLIDLDDYFSRGGPKGPYPGYVEAIANKRLAAYGATVTIKELFRTTPNSFKEYHGFDALVALSSGQVSKFLEIAKDILVAAQGGVEISERLLTEPIAQSTQRSVVIDHSNVFLEGTSGDAKMGRDVEAILSAWAEYCWQRAFLGTQRTLRFVIRDPENLGPREALALEHCLRRGVLQRATPRRPHSPVVATRMRAYRLHRLLCPRYELELYDHHQREIRAANIATALDSKENFVKSLLPRRVNKESLLPGEHEVFQDEQA